MPGGSRGIRAGRAYVELGTDDKTQAALLRVERRLKAMAATVGAIGAKLLAVGGAGAGGLALAARAFSNAGDAIEKMSGRTGLSAEALSELGHAADSSGSSLEAVEAGSRNLSRTLLDAARGGSEANNSLADLGVTAKQLEGLSPEQQFYAIADALSKIEDPSKRAALAMKVLGKSGTQLLPLFQGGARGLNQLRKEARDFGLTITTDQAKTAAKLNDAMGLMSAAIRAVVFQIGGALAPSLTRISKYIAGVAAITGKWVKQNRPLVVTIGKIVAGTVGAGAALVALSGGLFLAGKAFGAFAATFAAGKAVMAGGVALFGIAKSAVLGLSSPLGLLSIAIGATAAVFVVKSGVIGDAATYIEKRFNNMGGIVRDTVKGIVTAMRAGDIEAAAEVLAAGVKAAFVALKGDLIQVWIDIKEKIFKIVDEIVIGAAATIEGYKEQKQNVIDIVARQIIETVGDIEVASDPTLEKEQARRERLDNFDRETKANKKDQTAEKLERLIKVIEERDKAADARKTEFDAERQAAEDAADKELRDALDKLRRATEDAAKSAGMAGDQLSGPLSDSAKKFSDALDAISNTVARNESRGSYISERIERALDTTRTKTADDRRREWEKKILGTADQILSSIKNRNDETGIKLR